MSDVHLIKHPLLQHKLTLVRKRETGAKEFRELIAEIASIMIYEATRDLPLQEVSIRTPLCQTESSILREDKLTVVPILRAGLGMVEGVLKFFPAARVGHVGIYRHPETLEAVEYYCKLPAETAGQEVIILDPMLATGHSAAAAISAVTERGADVFRLISILAAPEGIDYLQEKHPEVDVYTAAIDQGLDEKSYIVPGLGDAGDRLYGTK